MHPLPELLDQGLTSNAEIRALREQGYDDDDLLEEINVRAYVRRLKGKVVSVRQHQRGRGSQRRIRRELRRMEPGDFTKRASKAKPGDRGFAQVQGEVARRTAAAQGARRAARRRVAGHFEAAAARQELVLAKRPGVRIKDLSDQELKDLTAAARAGFGNKADIGPASRVLKEREQRRKAEAQARARRAAAEMAAYKRQIKGMPIVALNEELLKQGGNKRQAAWDELIRQADQMDEMRRKKTITQSAAMLEEDGVEVDLPSDLEREKQAFVDELESRREGEVERESPNAIWLEPGARSQRQARINNTPERQRRLAIRRVDALVNPPDRPGSGLEVAGMVAEELLALRRGAPSPSEKRAAERRRNVRSLTGGHASLFAQAIEDAGV